MTKQMPKKYSHGECEKKWCDEWVKSEIYKFQKDVTKEPFIIDTPPPTISGEMHVGHAFSYSQQDFIARYKRMNGRNVFYPFGTDDNGLPTERLIEKLKKVDSNRMERAEFVKLCNETINEIQPKFIRDWVDIGMSCDFSTPYSTINEYCQKTSQASFLDLFKKGLVYREETPISWCVKCQTAIAQAEFENVELDSYFNDVAFSCGGEDLLVSTTRPELIPACVGLFFHPDDSRYNKLEGKFALVPLFDYEVPILSDINVDMEKGTGLMMVCTFGDKEDIEKWHKHNLELRIVFEKHGKLNKLAGKYEDLKIKDAREKILEDLKTEGFLKKQEKIKHNVNVHERCGTELEFLKTKQWYVRVLGKKRELLEAANQIKWYPEHMKSRYVHWVENLNWDWCISRQRHFGIPFPLWYGKDGEMIVADESQLPVDPEKDSPKNFEGKLSELVPEKDVMDTWATSSVSPQIILDWKGECGYGMNFDNYPCSIRPQAHDIIRTWAFYTIVKGLYHHGKVPWKEIVISGHVLDEKGKKLSKSKGNPLSPQKVMENYGADCLRLFAASGKLGDDLRFREEDLKTAQKTITKLWNASSFVFMHLKDYVAGKSYDPEKLEIMDRWLLIKLNHLINSASNNFEVYEYSKSKKDAEYFFWNVLCDNYLEIVKDRLYNPDNRGEISRLSGQYTLYNSLLSVLKIFAPIIPFVTEEIHDVYFAENEKEETLHLSNWPEPDVALDNVTVEKVGDRFVEILGEIRKFKSDNGKSLKEEVEVVLIEDDFKLLEKCMDDFKATTNARSVESGKEFSINF